jgi:hypothetical protein
MCECFKPAYSDFDFGYGLGVLGHLMDEGDHIGFHLFQDGDINDERSYLGHMKVLNEGIKAEIDRASRVPLEGMPQFVVSIPSGDFQRGYLAGLNEMKKGLLELSLLMINYPKKTLEPQIIVDWAYNWQEKHKQFHFHKVPAFAATDLGMGDELRILSSSIAWMSYDGIPSDRDNWLEFGVTPGLSAAQSLVAELWSLMAHSDQGLGFVRGNQSTGPEDPNEEVVTFEMTNLCDEHWSEISSFNTKLIEEAGLTPIID